MAMCLFMVVAFQDKNQALSTAHHILSSETCGLRYVEFCTSILHFTSPTGSLKSFGFFAPIVLLLLGVSHPGLASPGQRVIL